MAFPTPKNRFFTFLGKVVFYGLVIPALIYWAGKGLVSFCGFIYRSITTSPAVSSSIHPNEEKEMPSAQVKPDEEKETLPVEIKPDDQWKHPLSNPTEFTYFSQNARLPQIKKNQILISFDPGRGHYLFTLDKEKRPHYGTSYSISGFLGKIAKWWNETHKKGDLEYFCRRYYYRGGGREASIGFYLGQQHFFPLGAYVKALESQKKCMEMDKIFKPLLDRAKERDIVMLGFEKPIYCSSDEVFTIKQLKQKCGLAEKYKDWDLIRLLENTEEIPPDAAEKIIKVNYEGQVLLAIKLEDHERTPNLIWYVNTARPFISLCTEACCDRESKQDEARERRVMRLCAKKHPTIPAIEKHRQFMFNRPPCLAEKNDRILPLSRSRSYSSLG